MATLVRTTTPANERNRWRTPPEWFVRLSKEYGPFQLDAAADETNHLCDVWLGPGSPLGLEDALACPWGAYNDHRVYCNPPYNQTAAFVRKARNEVRAKNCASVTLLLPATTDVAWFHDYVWDEGVGHPRRGVLLGFSRGRIRFLRPDGSKAGQPTHGSMFVTFLPGC